MLVTEEEKKEAAKDEGGIKEKVMEFWGRDGGENGDGEDEDDDDDEAGNGKGGEKDPFSVSSGEEEEDVHEEEGREEEGREEEGREEEGREEEGREEEGREEEGEYPPIIITSPLMKIGRERKTTKLTTLLGEAASDSSSGSTQPPWSTNYPVSSDRRAKILDREDIDIEPKSYDVRVLGPEFAGITQQGQMENRAFLRSEHGYEDGWKGIKLLGEGSEGRAGLWEKSDGDGEVIDVSFPHMSSIECPSRLSADDRGVFLGH